MPNYKKPNGAYLRAEREYMEQRRIDRRNHHLKLSGIWVAGAVVIVLIVIFVAFGNA